MTKMIFNYFKKITFKGKIQKNDWNKNFIQKMEVIKATKDQLLELIASP